MAYESNPAWSPVFLRSGTTAQRRGRRGERRAGPGISTSPPVNEAIEEFLDAVDAGFARDRYARPFTPEAARELHWCLGGYVREELGVRSLRDVQRADVEALIYGLADAGVPHRRLVSLAKSMRALYDYAAELEVVRHNPAERVAIPYEHEAEQPTASDFGAVDPAPEQRSADRAVSLVLRLATLGVLLIALILLVQSL